MTNLQDLLHNIEPLEIVGRVEGCSNITALSYDSRTVENGGLFFAVVGEVADGHNYISKAIQLGAQAVVCERIPEQIEEGVCYIKVADSNFAMGHVASAFYGNPSSELKLIGITGTNGKTTTATLLYDLFTTLGYKVGLISTVIYKIGTESITSTHTTPDAIRLAHMMRRMVDEGCDFCFMEVSSHAIAQHRIEGLKFDGAIFSNITHDHLDYHKTFSEYIKVKKRLFDSLPKGAFALTNLDDRNGRVMVQNCVANIQSYSLRSMADFRAKVVEIHFNGMLLKLDGEELWVKFIGRFNAYNILAAYATAKLLGVEKSDILVALSTLHSVSGRFEYMTADNGTTIIIDYAHTPDALESVIATIEEIRTQSQDLYVVCGCGGDRDHDKRPEMARIATKYATLSIFTSDNPRTEDPEAILNDMMSGINGTSVKYLRITDRAEAIKTAVMLSKGGDIILIAGKGHETYQIIGTKRHHFDDREAVREALKMK
ncbi:MAG: UDP-N-acetylmuramoyl-L-alanyl-D-glutamate--2,6-diaminopimelate ligase [Rikenellaceae bacterium]